MNTTPTARNWTQISEVIAARFPAAKDINMAHLLNDTETLLKHLAFANDLTLAEARELYDLALLKPPEEISNLRAA